MSYRVKACFPNDIARALCISTETVYWHLATVRKILGVHNHLSMLYAVYHTKDLSVAHLTLTPRGQKVFRLLIQGDTDKEIGQKLGMSYSGVRRHKEKMLLENDCASMLELVGKYYSQVQT